MLGEKGPVDLTEDKFVVARITDLSEILSVTASLRGTTETLEFDLSGLTLEEEGD